MIEMQKIRIVMLLKLAVLLFVSELMAGELKILNIASYHPDNSWTSDCIEGIEGAVGINYRLEHHFMDTKRIPASEFPQSADRAWKKYRSSKPDLVMIGDDNALRLLGPRLADTGVTIVHYGVNNNPRSYFKGNIPDNVYGILERPLISPMIRHMETIIPGLKKILVMFDDSISSRAVISSAFYGKRIVSFPTGTIAEIRVIEEWEIWKSTLHASDKEFQAVIVANHFTLKDGKGHTIEDKDVIKQSSLLTPLPIFATNSFAVHPQGAVGALVILGQDHGRAAGELADELLSSRVKPTKHRLQRPGKFYFNKKQLIRFNLKLPQAMEKTAVFK